MLVIGGPTASGKTEVAIEIALKFEGEIINADSVQIYRGMDIGTAKPSLKERSTVPHHLFDVASPAFPWDAKRFEEEATNLVEEVIRRGKLPILVGGSGFYIKAFLEEVPDGVGKDDVLRKKLSERLLDELYLELKRIDPERAKEIHPHDKKRIIRALEIYYITGRKPSDFRWREKEHIDALKIAVTRNVGELKDRIFKRVDQMFEKGWLEEVRKLVDMYGKDNIILSSTLGYREIIQYLEGEIESIETLKTMIKQATWDYAKRQIKWFRKEGFEFFSLPEEKEKLFLRAERWLGDDKNNRR